MKKRPLSKKDFTLSLDIITLLRNLEVPVTYINAKKLIEFKNKDVEYEKEKKYVDVLITSLKGVGITIKVDDAELLLRDVMRTYSSTRSLLQTVRIVKYYYDEKISLTNAKRVVDLLIAECYDKPLHAKV